MTALMSISCRVVIRLALPYAFPYSNTGENPEGETIVNVIMVATAGQSIP